MKFTPEDIKGLEPDEVFVFGSNLSGIHGKGGALFAKVHFGAKPGVAFGRTGQCFAIPTRGKWIPHLRTFRPLEIEVVGERVWDFLTYAKEHPELKFLVTKIGCGYAGFSTQQMGKLFSLFGPIPENVSLPKEFWFAVV